MPYSDADLLLIRPVLLGRIEGVVSDKALYLINNESATEQQKEWARRAIRNTASMADQVSRHILHEQALKDNGSSVADAALASMVGTAIDKHFIAQVPETEV